MYTGRDHQGTEQDRRQITEPRSLPREDGKDEVEQAKGTEQKQCLGRKRQEELVLSKSRGHLRLYPG